MKRKIFFAILLASLAQFSIFADDNNVIQREITFLSIIKDGVEIKGNYSSFGNLVTTRDEDIINIQLINNFGIQETFKLSTLLNNVYVFVEHFSPFGRTINGASGTFTRSNDGKYTARIYVNRQIHYEFLMQLYVPQNENQIGNGLTFPGGDIYIAGYSYSWMPGHISQVALIKNNESWYLTDGSREAAAYSMSVDGSVIYLAGQEGGIAKCWIVNMENNTVEDITVTDAASSCIYSIYVLRNNIYLAGEENNAAKYWILNRVQNTLRSYTLTNGNAEAKAVSIFVSGLIVYVAGYEGNVAKYWRSGVATDLTDGRQNSSATSMFVSGSDVYICGFEGDRAIYWKNGIRIELSNGSQNAGAASIFVSGSDVYCGGWLGRYATYWKNGVPVDVSNGNRHTVQVARDRTMDIEESHSSIISMVVTDDNVQCIIGMGYSALSLGSGTSVFWTNGTQTSLEIRTTSLIVIRNRNN